MTNFPVRGSRLRKAKNSRRDAVGDSTAAAQWRNPQDLQDGGALLTAAVDSRGSCRMDPTPTEHVHAAN